MTKDGAFLRHVAREFEEGFNSGDVDRLMKFYADQYVDINLRKPVQSKGERRNYYAAAMARLGIHLTISPDDILVRGDLAFVRGTLLLAQAAATGGESTRRELRYLEIYERGVDGTWRVIWGMDGPVQEYASGTPDQ